MRADELEAEEPWEAEVSALLGSLPEVEPPDGFDRFLVDVLDHPPLHAGRILAGLVGGAVVALVALVAVVAAPPGSVIPQVETLTSRHAASRADLLGGGAGPADADDGPCGDAADCSRAWVASQVDVPVDLPDGFRAEAGFAADDLEQAVYARNGDAVSVFVQRGEVDWSRLPTDGQRLLGDVPAWVEPGRQVAVLQVGEEVVTIVGLDPDEVEELVATIPSRSSGAGHRARSVLLLLAEQLGLDTDG